MDVDKLEAGSELDALVAEKVMGWHLASFPRTLHEPPSGLFWCDPSGSPRRTRAEWSPSDDIAVAWEVVAAVAAGPACCIGIETRTFPDRRVMFHVELNPAVIGEGEAEYYTQSFLAPLAICRAALKAVEA